MTAPPVLLRQTSALDGFAYEFVDEQGAVVGAFEFANFAQARNARLKVHATGSRQGDIPLRMGDRRAFVCFEYLRRGFTNDVRYTLEVDEDSAARTLASADVLFTDTQAQPRVLIRSPVQAEVLCAESLFRKSFGIVGADGSVLGHVREPKALSLKRELQAFLPGVDPLVLAFVAIVVLCVRY